MSDNSDIFSAGQQALGYQYQPRFGMLRMMELPEDTALLIEKDDDLDFTNGEDDQILASLKHKAPGDRLTDLSPDFWKSIRIWLTRYKADGKQASRLSFFLFTTGSVAEGSFLVNFIPRQRKPNDLINQADDVLALTRSPTILKIKSDFDELSSEEKSDFLLRITIFDHQVRIDEIPEKIMSLMRSVRISFRPHVFQRLEGWWNNQIINLMTGKRTNPIYGSEISEVLAEFSDQFKKENLPIDFRNSEPPDGVDPENDNRMFVRQLQALGLKPNRVRRSILDYYRAFEQRGSWLREQIVLNGELEDYEDRLVDEWDRFKNICYEHLEVTSDEQVLRSAGQKLLDWAETNNSERLRIRPLVTEAYVMMGSFHILANEHPLPKVYWHPTFIERLDKVLSNTEP
jgi:hypothetical protein